MRLSVEERDPPFPPGLPDFIFIWKYPFWSWDGSKRKPRGKPKSFCGSPKNHTPPYSNDDSVSSPNIASKPPLKEAKKRLWDPQPDFQIHANPPRGVGTSS